jgi:fermentation-respiration switch protein FrsA (DUF1100 family)
MLGAVVYMMCTLMLALVQRSLIYFPTRAAAVLPADAGLPSDRVSAVQITSEDGLTLHGWHVLPPGRGTETFGAADSVPSATGAVILYFSGNAGHRGYRGDELRTLADLDAQVFLFDYRGYGENPGRPTEKDLIRDALTAWRYLVDTHKIDPARIILFGESLGGGVAVRLAANLCGEGTAPGGLILRSTFSSLVDVAAHHYPWMPVRLLMIDRFESEQRIPAVTCPILQIHGSRDTIVPVRFARRLFEAAPPQSATGIGKQFAELASADHNDIPYVSPAEYRAAMASFLDAVGRPK